MRNFTPAAVVVFVVLLLAARVSPSFGFDPLGPAFEALFRVVPLGILTALLMLALVALATLKIYRWGLQPTENFPWWDVGSYSVVLLVLVVAYARYGDGVRS